MKNLAITLICLVLFGSAIGQSLTIEHIDNWINLCEPDLDLSTKGRLYVIEGVPYDGSGLKEKLREFDTSSKHFYLDYLNSDSVEATFLKPNLIIVLIQNIQKANLKQRKRELESAQNRFKDQCDIRSHHIMADSKDPVLYIDDNEIRHAEAMKKINALSAKEIQFVVAINHAPIIYYGQNARNGLVRIWTINNQ